MKKYNPKWTGAQKREWCEMKLKEFGFKKDMSMVGDDECGKNTENCH